jgi:hypothetical protein
LEQLLAIVPTAIGQAYDRALDVATGHPEMPGAIDWCCFVRTSSNEAVSVSSPRHSCAPEDADSQALADADKKNRREAGFNAVVIEAVARGPQQLARRSVMARLSFRAPSPTA